MSPWHEGDQWVWVPFEVDKAYDGLRVDQFLAKRLESYSRSKIQKILEDGRIQKDNRLIRASSRVRTGDKIQVAYPRRPETPLTEAHVLPILFEDDALLIINKPANLLSHPTDKIQLHTVTSILKHQRPDIEKIHLLHRLDRETSGVLALAKSTAAARRWTASMEKREIHKEYIAFVRGIPSPPKGTIDTPIGREGGEIKVRQNTGTDDAVPALTRYEVKKTWDDAAVVHAFPETGRLHQIRVHMASIGHPLLGDLLYQGTGAAYLKMVQKKLTPEDVQASGFSRLALHAYQLTFPHPLTGKTHRITAPLPQDMKKLYNPHRIK